MESILWGSQGERAGASRLQDIHCDFQDTFRAEREHQQDHHNAYQSAREEQWDSSRDYGDESSDEEPDDIITYDMEHSWFSTVFDQECYMKRTRHQANHGAHRKQMM